MLQALDHGQVPTREVSTKTTLIMKIANAEALKHGHPIHMGLLWTLILMELAVKGQEASESPPLPPLGPYKLHFGMDSWGAVFVLGA